MNIRERAERYFFFAKINCNEQRRTRFFENICCTNKDFKIELDNGGLR